MWADVRPHPWMPHKTLVCWDGKQHHRTLVADEVYLRVPPSQCTTMGDEMSRPLCSWRRTGTWKDGRPYVWMPLKTLVWWDKKPHLSVANRTLVGDWVNRCAPTSRFSLTGRE